MGLSINRIVSILSERAGKSIDATFQEELKDIVQYWRATILKDALRKRPNDRNYFMQSFTEKLIQVPKVECPIEYGCILRTERKIPTTIRSGGILYDYVGTPLWDNSFGMTNGAKDLYFTFNKFTGNRYRYEYKDNYIYIYNASLKNIKYIGIRGIFENPRDLNPFRCNKEECYNDDMDYPLSDDLVQQVINAILKTELRLLPIETEKEVNVNKDAN